ncbi:hypothetical protein ERS140147_01319 [Staphylococcus schweitzeri]|uniref:Uncharacterized protein n=1 Tax=Staphylococcus schweitzeri TaxID=1654388 RepID=A0A077UM45_9STAP|nr:hypothetical protein ERS140147_01319 [Staphylococcus schweitzeri]
MHNIILKTNVANLYFYKLAFVFLVEFATKCKGNIKIRIR